MPANGTYETASALQCAVFGHNYVVTTTQSHLFGTCQCKTCGKTIPQESTSMVEVKPVLRDVYELTQHLSKLKRDLFVLRYQSAHI